MSEQIIWQAKTPGIPDRFFTRGQVPMTKEEIRVLTLCKGQLTEASIVYDLGAGTGSIAIEAALQARKGHVYAVERQAEGVRLIRENMARFGVDNITVLHREAPEALEGLPAADCIFIGGSGGRLEEIIAAGHTRLKAGGRMVLNAITLETLWKAVKALEEIGEYDLDLCSLSVTRVEKMGSSHMFKGLNPVYIITGQKGVSL